MTRPLLPRRGYTLIELLVVIGILAIVLGLSAVGIQKMRAAAARAACANNLKQLGMACHGMNQTHRRMPPAFGFYPEANIYNGSNGLGNVFFHLLPSLQQDALYEKSRHQPPGTPQQNYLFYTTNDVHQQQMPVFNCPSDPTLIPGVNPRTNYAPSSYAANYLVFGRVDAAFANRNAQGQPQVGVTFADGASQTILFAEKYAAASISAANNNGTAFIGGCHWAYFQATCDNPLFAYHEPGRNNQPSPTDANAVGPSGAGFQIQPNALDGCNPCLPATGHAAMNVCLADGSVRNLAGTMDSAAWWALVTPNGKDRAVLD